MSGVTRDPGRRAVATRWAISILTALVCWEVLSRSAVVDATLFPPPTKVAAALIGWAQSGALFSDAMDSIWRAWLGFAIGAAAGTAIGVCTGRLGPIRDYVAPLLLLTRPLPPVAMIPLMIVWFGIGSTAKVTSIAVAVFFPVWMNCHLAARDIPRSYLWAAKSLHLGRLATLVRVVLPATLPATAAGARVAVAVAFVMLYVTELSGASAGIGYRISVSHLAYQIDTMIAALAVLAAIAAATDILVAASLRHFFPWIGANR